MVYKLARVNSLRGKVRGSGLVNVKLTSLPTMSAAVHHSLWNEMPGASPACDYPSTDKQAALPNER